MIQNFKTTLFQALVASDSVICNSFEIDDIRFDANGGVRLECAKEVIAFLHDQDVSIDELGKGTAEHIDASSDEEALDIVFKVMAPLTARHLSKVLMSDARTAMGSGSDLTHANHEPRLFGFGAAPETLNTLTGLSPKRQKEVADTQPSTFKGTIKTAHHAYEATEEQQTKPTSAGTYFLTIVYQHFSWGPGQLELYSLLDFKLRPLGRGN